MSNGEKPERKVIQISLGVYQGICAMALCDDGTMWLNERPHDPHGKINCDWIRVRSIPQDEAERE